jgi:nicotinate-nucleotide pyrophosphorylase (carboxylating)
MTDFLAANRRHFHFKEFMSSALAEDTGEGDHTAHCTIPRKKQTAMQLLVKEKGVLAGVEAAEKIMWHIDRRIVFRQLLQDGTIVSPGQIAFTVKGNAARLLMAERLVLNVMQRMSGIATKTADYAGLCAGTKARVTDTRKTTPGFRFFEKWAVHIGGGINHRFGLYDMILIKDNHIDLAGGIKNALDSCKTYLHKNKLKLKVEIEARNLKELNEILAIGPCDRILLDNFSVPETKKAVGLIGSKYEVESSGGITHKNIRQYALCGVDFISVGALTHQVRSLDLSLKVV